MPHPATADRSTPVSGVLLVVLSILLPPLGVALARGFTGAFWLNLLLTLLGYIPGLVHAVWLVARSELN